MATRCEVELDIYSGMPNPTWVLTNAEAESFCRRLAALSQTSVRELSANLGYRGFIVRLIQEGQVQWIRMQNGIVHISKGGMDVYADDKDRALEWWLLNTGRPHLNNDVLQIVEREFR